MKFLHALDSIAKWALYPIGFGIAMNETAGGASGGLLQQYLQGGSGRRGKSDRTIAKPGSPVGGRDIFEFLHPEGFKCNPAFTQSEDDNLLTNPADGDSAGSPGKKLKPLYVKCNKCDKVTYANRATEYTGVASHAKSCHGEENLIAAINELREKLSEGLTEEEKKLVQVSYQIFHMFEIM